MKLFRLCVFAFIKLIIISSVSFAQQNVVELKTCDCSDQVTHNKTVLLNAIHSNTLVQLPAGKFYIDPIIINGIDNLTIQGAGNGATLETKIEFTSGGMNLSNITNMRMENLEIQGSDGSNLVVLSNAGALSADNLHLTIRDGVLPTKCLQPNLDWLVPVISLILN